MRRSRLQRRGGNGSRESANRPRAGLASALPSYWWCAPGSGQGLSGCGGRWLCPSARTDAATTSVSRAQAGIRVASSPLRKCQQCCTTRCKPNGRVVAILSRRQPGAARWPARQSGTAGRRPAGSFHRGRFCPVSAPSREDLEYCSCGVAEVRMVAFPYTDT